MDESTYGRRKAVLVLIAVLLGLEGEAARAAGEGWTQLGPDALHNSDQWLVAGDAALNPHQPRLLVGKPGKGVLINGKVGKCPSLVTKQVFQDVELHVEFLVAKGSNSGVIFHGNHEIQILDSAHVKQPTGGHCGGVYPRAEAKPTYRHIDKGSPPRVNAALPPGEWQTFDIIFQAARFDKAGKKTAHARFVKVVHNGKVIQENVEVPYACGPNWDRKQHPRGVIVFQGDYGPVAFRDLRVRPWKGQKPRPLNVPPEGFKALFNGKDFTNWRVHPKVREFWSIEDGVLKSAGLLKEWGADLATVKHYRDFVLMLEFRMPTISDSGVMFRRLVPEIPGFGNQEQFNLRSKGGMGHLESYYFLPKATAKARGLKQETKPHVRHIDPEVGVWHKVKITMRGRTITTELDGEVLLDNFKYHDWMINTDPAPIRLQKHKVVHGDNLGKENPCPIEYRNIFIKELEPPRQNVPPKGFTALFNGKDLTGWRASPKVKELWSIEGGVLKSSAPREADLFTEKEYRDFVLMVDYRMPEESDSGIYFRRLTPEMGTFGQREQLNLTAGRGGWMGNLLSFHFLPAGLQLNEKAHPQVRRVAPAVGAWHTIKLTVIGREVTAECDGETMIDRFVYPEGLLSMAPGAIGLQKHAPADPSARGNKGTCPIEFRNVFIKEIKPSAPNAPPKGFTALFNGKNFSGWRLSPAVREAWSIEDGILKSHKPIKDWGSDLRTVKKYRDFVLMVDYRIPRISDSGIYIRGLMPGIGIFDRDRWEQFNLRSRGGTGTLESFRFQPPDRRVEPPRVRPIDPEVGVWHTVKLTLVGSTLSAEYDGERIIDEYEYADGVLSMEPSVIRLQKHPPSEIGGEMSDCPIEFRNVFIKELKPSGFPKVIQRPELNAPPRGFAAMFNGKDLTGWQVTPAVKKAWKIEDGVLKAHGQIEEWGADLVTKEKYQDFVLLVDFRFPTISDSGIWFRGIPGIMGGMEQFNLMSVYGTGNLDSLDHLPKDVQLTFRSAAYKPFFYCQPEYYRLKDPPVRYTDPEVGVWHTVKLTLIGRTLSAELDGQVIHDRFEYPEGTISMAPAVIRLQKHIPQRIAGKLYRECPIEFRNVFIKDLGQGSAEGPARPGRHALDSPTAKLLSRIEANALPQGYDPRKHQAYVDRRMAGLSQKQRGRVGQLWKEKQRIQPRMANRGASFVKILEYVATHGALDEVNSEGPKRLRASTNSLKADEEDIQRWREMKFGLFIHWGPISLLGEPIGWSRGGERRGWRGKGHVPVEVYDNLYKRFNPVKFNAGQWAQMAKDAGMKYLVFICKHHDGFCMFDSKLTDHKITNSPFKRDVLKELAGACHKAGLKFGCHYSLPDWYHPDYRTKNHQRYIEFMHGQLREICSSYGRIDIIWWDGLGGSARDWDSVKLFRLIRRLQPHVIINSRGGLPGDHQTEEQRIGTPRFDRPWECNMTLGTRWAWIPNDKIKPLRQCIQTLVRVVGGDGNYLLDVGPMADGRIEPGQVARLKEIGEWLRSYGSSIYLTRGGPFISGSWGASTYRGNTIYVHVLSWQEDSITLPPIPHRIIGSSVLTGGTARVKQTNRAIEVSVPQADRRELDTIIVLELDGAASEIAPRPLPYSSLTAGKKATASNAYQNPKPPHNDPDRAVDDDVFTRWATDAGTKQAWLEVDLGKPITFNRTRINEEFDRVRRFEMQLKDGSRWKTFARGTRIGRDYSSRFEPVTARHVRLNILEATDGPSIWEFQLFAPRR